METYKHSCPACAQHVEYTLGYCGTQMQCPSCGKTITFPAIPPSRDGVALAGNRPKPVKLSWNPFVIFARVASFPHWNTVVQIALPFVVIGALLGGALFVKKKFADEPVGPAVPVVEGQSGGWDKMNDLARADQKMKQDVKAINDSKRAVAGAQRVVDMQERQLEQAHDADERQAISGSIQSAQRSLTQAQNTFTYLHQLFRVDLEKYHQLGGTIDYENRIPY